MPIKKYKPTSPGRRHGSVLDYAAELTTRKPEKSLLRPLKKTGGRNNQGHITSRRRGGGHKRRYRLIEFRRKKDGVPAQVASIEYDPNRSANIALLKYADGFKSYILAPVGIQVGQTVVCGPGSEPTVGNCMALKDIPVGLQVHAIELYPGQGAQICRSAGTQAQLFAREGEYAVVQMPSGELRRIHVECRATIGARRQPRPPEREARQGRSQAPPGPPPEGARHGDEPARPPARRGRGPHQGWAPPLLADGRAGQGWPPPPQEPPLRQVHPAQQAQAQVGAPVGRSIKKGPYIDPKVQKKVDAANAKGQEGPDQDLGALVHRDARLCRAHLHGPQRPQTT